MANIWWCNQRQCWRGERANGVVCSSGEATVLKYRQTVGEVKAGDIIVHYRSPYIVAISRAQEAGREGFVPPIGQFEYGNGWTFATEYFDLQHPIHRDAVNNAIYALHLPDSPVLSNGWIRQAYFMPFDKRGLEIVLAAGDEEWPEWVRNV